MDPADPEAVRSVASRSGARWPAPDAPRDTARDTRRDSAAHSVSDTSGAGERGRRIDAGARRAVVEPAAAIEPHASCAGPWPPGPQAKDGTARIAGLSRSGRDPYAMALASPALLPVHVDVIMVHR